MQIDKTLLKQLSSELASLCSDMLELESSLIKRFVPLHEAHRRSARNLAHYLALRRHDIRKLQYQLALLGLSLWAGRKAMSSMLSRLSIMC